MLSSFACCEREDESKYLHPCDCPSAVVECESEQYSYALCGFSEFSNGSTVVPSTPPKAYLTRTKQNIANRLWYSCCCTPYLSVSTIGTTEVVDSYQLPGCTLVNGSVTGQHTTTRVYHSGCNTVDCELVNESSQETTSQPSPGGGTTVQSTTLIQNVNEEHQTFSVGDCSGQTATDDTQTFQTTLTNEDTEQAAIARATPEAGTSCSSRYETRKTEFSWIKRTSGYKIVCSNLQSGFTYRIYPKIRKRTAQDDGSGTWEDVELVPEYVEFTATSDTYTKDDGAGEYIQLDHTQGWEYEITGASIERKAPSV